MRKLILSLAAIAAVGVTLPAISNPAAADPVVVIRRDHGPHYSNWRRHHERDWAFRHRHHDTDRQRPALIVR